MDLISFDALRTLNLPAVHYIKPQLMYGHLDRIRAADGVLFPEFWQINPLVFGLKTRIFPSLASYLIGHNKVEMTRCFQAIAPANVPYTLIEPNTADAAERVWDAMPLPFVAKIPKSSMGQGVFLIEAQSQWRDYLACTDVIYAQEYLPIDRDLRVIWVGRQVVACYWRLQADRGFYNNLSQGGHAVQGPVPAAALELVEHLALSLGIDHGGFDIALVELHPYVFEFNRLFGNRGLENLGARVEEAILQYLQESWYDDDDDEPGRPRSPRLPEAV